MVLNSINDRQTDYISIIKMYEGPKLKALRNLSEAIKFVQYAGAGLPIRRWPTSVKPLGS